MFDAPCPPAPAASGRIEDHSRIEIVLADRERLELTLQEWFPGPGCILVEAVQGTVRLTAYLTLREVFGGTDVGVHAEAARSDQAKRLLALVGALPRRGMSHLGAELSRSPDG